MIGVQTPEFWFEHELDRVWKATEDRAIDYPVARDGDYEVWSAFDNHYWPALCTSSCATKSASGLWRSSS